MSTLFARIIGFGRAIGPYLAIEMLLPGGSLIALLLWAYRVHNSAKAHATHTVDTTPRPRIACTRGSRWLAMPVRT